MKGLIMERKGIFGEMSIEMTLIGLLLLLSSLPLSSANQPQPSDRVNADAWKNANLTNGLGNGPDKAILCSPSGTLDTGTPTYKWYAVKGTTFYCLNVNDSSGKPVVNQCYKAEDLSPAGSLSFTPSTLLRSGDYKWRIQTWSCSKSNWSDEMPFSIGISPPDNVCPISPQGLISTSTPTFVWTAVPTATKYLLQIENQNGIIFNGSYMAENVTQGYKCNVFSPLILPDGILFWRVQASNDAGPGRMSGYAWFESICGGASKKNSAKAKGGRKPESIISIPWVFAA
jgi:hypothetical protein